MMTTTAITGATGFVGSALARALVQQGHDVVALTRAGSNRSRLGDVKVAWIPGDVTEAAGIPEEFLKADQVIHAAGMLGQAGVPEAAYHHLHAGGTLNVLEAVRTSGHAMRVLLVSSPGVLGPIGVEAADENQPLAPSNPYERSKAEAEQVARKYAEAGLDVVIGRPEFIYGPGDKHVLGLFRAIQKGTFFYTDRGRHFCHPTFIDDAVDGLVRVLQNGRAGEVYHIAGPRPVTFRELGETVAAALGVAAPRLSLPRPMAWLGAAALEAVGQVSRRQPPLTRTGVAFFSEDRRFSIEKARRELGYEPQYDLARGVVETVAWYREEGLL
jgi:nucleoside-diphosphate-sugar epimerase